MALLPTAEAPSGRLTESLDPGAGAEFEVLMATRERTVRRLFY